MKYRFGLIGYPVTHSLSPWIHAEFMKRAGLNGSYELYEIKPNDSFNNKIKELKNEKLNGFNITAPYKKTIMPFLDELDKQAEAIGAVNTVVNENGKWVGYNTDGDGYLRSLVSVFPSISSAKYSKIIILGAGGAARAILYTLFENGFKNIDIANRSLQSASELKAYYNLRDTRTLTLSEAEKTLGEYDIIIQTTSVGMGISQFDKIVEITKLPNSSIVSDIIYKPVKTSFLQQADILGARIHYGHSMLLYQAQYAFELWTGIRVPLEKMEQDLLKKLEG
ncbi:shikimate dehydrogenase [Virgibacillus flavescens]|uniref:shikimate dehydrogenase n=1 Tax=Virgibacillus flavescens TaxID=1611422 RepID=UPI003D32F766